MSIDPILLIIVGLFLIGGGRIILGTWTRLSRSVPKSDIPSRWRD
jgi:hypothetical protein